jgi:hypothetical protein
MSIVTFGKMVSLKQAATAILANPTLRFYLEGEPGIGKSSIMKELSRARPNHRTSYTDMASLDLGDVAMPWVDKDSNTTRYAANARFGLHDANSRPPVIIMLDEFSKGAAPVQNMLHPMLEKSKPRLGDNFLQSEDYVLLTGNLASDGVGDRIKAHTANRVVRLKVRKPTSEEWLEWASGNNIDPVVMSFVHQYPHVMASYLDDPKAAESNPYIYNPKVVQDAYASPRSLETASDIIKVREQVGAETTIACLIGAVGEACARDMQAFVEYQDQLPSWDSIIANPDKAKVPEGAGACAVMVFGAIQKLDKQNMTPFMQYLGRFETEWQACFAVHVASNPAKQQVAFSNRAFAEWMRLNTDIV